MPSNEPVAFSSDKTTANNEYSLTKIADTENSQTYAIQSLSSSSVTPAATISTVDSDNTETQWTLTSGSGQQFLLKFPDTRSARGISLDSTDPEETENITVTSLPGNYSTTIRVKTATTAPHRHGEDDYYWSMSKGARAAVLVVCTILATVSLVVLIHYCLKCMSMRGLGVFLPRSLQRGCCSTSVYESI